MAKKNWLKRLFSSDRRRADRQPVPDLIAHYWTGAAPAGTRVKNISATGLYLVTNERWYPGTVIKVILQKEGAIGDDPDDYITVQAEAVRHGNDGVGLVFRLRESEDVVVNHQKLDSVAGEKSLFRFLRRVLGNGK